MENKTATTLYQFLRTFILAYIQSPERVTYCVYFNRTEHCYCYQRVTCGWQSKHDVFTRNNNYWKPSCSFSCYGYWTFSTYFSWCWECLNKYYLVEMLKKYFVYSDCVDFQFFCDYAIHYIYITQFSAENWKHRNHFLYLPSCDWYLSFNNIQATINYKSWHIENDPHMTYIHV